MADFIKVLLHVRKGLTRPPSERGRETQRIQEWKLTGNLLRTHRLYENLNLLSLANSNKDLPLVAELTSYSNKQAAHLVNNEKRMIERKKDTSTL